MVKCTPPPVIDRCTVHLRNGLFCDGPSAPDVPFPICPHHALRLYKRMHQTIVEFGDEMHSRALSRAPEFDTKRRQQLKAQSVVYYVRIGDRVKIGFTTNIKQRLSGLRIYDADHVLATEPGGRDLERRRHQEFADERVSPRHEDFNPSRKLLAHIALVREQHGEPKVTTFPHVA